MQRESVQLVFVSHRKVALQVNISGRNTHGHTELIIAPFSQDLKMIHLQDDRCDICSVSVAAAPGTEAIKLDF
ncbi:hypothetical protein FRC07_010300, partial [Ceratobasidium sp. 392]